MRFVAQLLVVSVLLVCASCSAVRAVQSAIPRVHKITIQQGNVITQDMIDQLKPGMTRSQVAFVMGEPIARNTFNEDRWDYIYTVEIPGILKDQKRVSLYFENDVLAYFAGDYAPTEAAPQTAPQDTASTE